MVQEISHINSHKYIIPNCQSSNGKRELNVQANIKMKNGKKLKVKTLVDSRCTHTGISQGQKNPNEADKLLIQSFQCRWNQECGSDQGGASRN